MVTPYSDLADASDEALVDQTLAGSMAAYDEIVRRYQQRVAASLHHLCRNPSDLEDLVQETFIRSFHKLSRWQPKAPLLAWIRRIGYNLAYDYLRKQRRNPLALRNTPMSAEPTDRAETDGIPDESVAVDVSNSRNDLIDWLLRQLRPDEALVITLLHVEQRSVHDIAERLGWSPSKVKIKAFRARQQLRQHFEYHETLNES